MSEKRKRVSWTDCGLAPETINTYLAHVAETANTRRVLTEALELANADYHAAVLEIAGKVNPQRIADAAGVSRAAVFHITAKNAKAPVA